MLRSLVDTFVHTGWMPDSRIAGANGMTQGGSNGDVVVADAMAKGVTGIDYRKAYEAMVKNAEVDSPRPLYEGRALAEYKQLGYVSLNYPTFHLAHNGIRLQRFLCRPGGEGSRTCGRQREVSATLKELDERLER